MYKIRTIIFAVTGIAATIAGIYFMVNNINVKPEWVTSTGIMWITYALCVQNEKKYRHKIDLDWDEIGRLLNDVYVKEDHIRKLEYQVAQISRKADIYKELCQTMCKGDKA